MGNTTVSTSFELHNLTSYLKGIEQAKKATESLAQPVSRDTTLQKAQAEIKKYQAENLRAEQQITRQVEREAKVRADVQIKEAKRANDAAIRELKQLEREQKRADQERADRIKNFRSSVSTAIVAGFGTGVYLTKEALDRTKEAEGANRSLTSSATEAGKAYSVLAKEALQFGKDAAISTTQAQRATAELQKVLTLAGKPNELQKYAKGFLDIAAGRGYDSNELSTLFSAIISGEDQPINRAGLPNPGVLKAQYAKQIGKNPNDLTQQEEILSRLLAFEKQFDSFAGKNAERLAETSGEAGQLSKSLNDVADSFSLALTQSQLFREDLHLLSELFKAIAGYDPITVRIRLQQGESPRKLAEEANSGFWNDVWRGTKALASGIPAVGVLGYDLLTGNPNAWANYQGAVQPSMIYNRDVDYTESELTKIQKGLQNQAQQAEIERQNFSPNTYLAWQKAQLEALNKTAPKQSLKDFNLEIKQADENLGKLQQILSKVKNDLFLEPDTKSTLIDSLEDKIESITEKIIKLRQEASKTIRDAQTNLLGLRGDTLASIFQEGANAIESFEEKFGKVAPDMVRQFRSITDEITRTKVALQQFENQNKAFDLRQRSRELGRLLPSEIGGFGRRLSGLESVLGFASNSANYSQQSYLDRLFAANPFSQYNPVQYQLDNYQNISNRFDDLARKFGNLGILGQATIAQAKLNALPDSQTLIQLAQQGNRSAIYGLSQRSDLNSILAQAEEQKIRDVFYRESRFKKSIDEQLAYIDQIKRRGGIPTSTRLDEIIGRYDRIGVENLSQGDINQLMNILNQRADVLDREKQQVNQFYKLMNSIITENEGLKTIIVKGATADIEVKDKRISVVQDGAPTMNDTARAMGGGSFISEGLTGFGQTNRGHMGWG